MANIRCGNFTFSNIQVIVFDKDGTLANSELFLRSLGQKRCRLLDAQIPGVQEPLLMAFGLEDARLNPGGLLAAGSRQENAIAAAAYVAETGKDWLAARQIVDSVFADADRYCQRKAEETPLFSGALELLQRLAAAGIKLGILSADMTENVKDFVHQYALEPYIQCQLGGDSGFVKPDPKFFEQACRALGVEPGQAMMVGDTELDFEMAQAAGAAGCIGASWGWTIPPVLDRADAIASQYNDIQVINKN